MAGCVTGYGLQYYGSGMEVRVTGEGCSDKGKVFLSSESMIALWIGSGRGRPL